VPYEEVLSGFSGLLSFDDNNRSVGATNNPIQVVKRNLIGFGPTRLPIFPIDRREGLTWALSASIPATVIKHSFTVFRDVFINHIRLALFRVFRYGLIGGPVL
jgi:hypothetical protein